MKDATTLIWTRNEISKDVTARHYAKDGEEAITVVEFSLSSLSTVAPYHVVTCGHALRIKSKSSQRKYRKLGHNNSFLFIFRQKLTHGKVSLHIDMRNTKLNFEERIAVRKLIIERIN